MSQNVIGKKHPRSAWCRWINRSRGVHRLVGTFTMTDPVNFALAVLFLLSVPGPTNTLLATAATTSSFRTCLSLMPAEMAGYTISINILLTFVRPFAEASVVATVILRTICACYLLYIAWTLWHSAGRSIAGPISFRHVFMTTLLNPKAVVFALVVFPDSSSPQWIQLRSLGLFLGICAFCCSGWLTLGAAIGRRADFFVTPDGFQRGAAVALVIFAVVMAGSLTR
jgi:threonine/homoserine/homoserine lactone efflux protein